MPRPRKCRKVCCLPKVSEFMPSGGASDAACVVMTVDEYETIRLIDKENFSQEECGKYMHIARTTVQQIYDSARKKLAEVVVDGICSGLKAETIDYVMAQKQLAGAADVRNIDAELRD